MSITLKTAFPMKRLGDVAEVDRDIIDASDIADQTKYVGLEHIEGESGAVSPLLVANGELASAKHRFSPAHVLYGKLRPYLRKIACPSFTGVCSTDIVPIRPGRHLDRRYLYHILRHPEYIALASSRSQGANLPRLSPKQLEDFEIPFPKLDVQENIASILDKADAIRRKREQALRLTDDFLRSVFLDMFGEPGRHGWEILTVTDVLAPRDGAIRTGPFGSQLRHSEFVDEGIAVLGIDNAVSNEFRWGKPRFITEDKYEEMKRYTVRPGDVIITIMGTVGRCAIVPDDIPIAINTKHLCCITLDHQKCLPEFLHAYFLTHPVARKYLASTAKGAIMDGLNMGIIKAMPVPQVPLHLQEKYREVVRKHHQMKTRLTAHQAEAETLFSSLQQRAFSGQL